MYSNTILPLILLTIKYEYFYFVKSENTFILLKKLLLTDTMLQYSILNLVTFFSVFGSARHGITHTCNRFIKMCVHLHTKHTFCLTLGTSGIIIIIKASIY